MQPLFVILSMSWQAISTAIIIVLTIGASFRNHHYTSRYFLIAASVAFLLDINDLSESLVGARNEGVLTLILMLLISAVLHQRGFLDSMIARILPGKALSPVQFTFRTLIPASLLSGFLNNTPIVALLLQPVRRWADKYSDGRHLYLLPLSYAAIIGGTLTLVGTSTNLVVIGLLSAEQIEHQLHLFSPAMIGLALLVSSSFYFVWLIHRLKRTAKTVTDNSKPDHFSFSTKLTQAELVQKTLVAAGLRQLEHGYLYQIKRQGGDVIDAQSLTQLQKDDELYFLGRPDLANELAALGYQVQETEQAKDQILYEVVVPLNSALRGKTPKQIDFRTNYGAAIVSVAHQAKNIIGRLGEYHIQPGDLLLLCADKQWSSDAFSSDLLLLNQTELTRKNTLPGKLLVLGGFAGSLLIGSFTAIGLLKCLLVYLCLLFICRVTDFHFIRSKIPLDLLVILLCALALAQATVNSGLAVLFVNCFGGLIQEPISALIAIYLLTWVLTEALTNNAAAAIALPFALSLGDAAGLSVEQSALTVMIAASSSFISPFGYQTNLMVMSAGNYKPSDYVYYGFPLVILVMVITLITVGFMYPLFV